LEKYENYTFLESLAYSISNQENNASIFPNPIWPPSLILQHGRHETGFC